MDGLNEPGLQFILITWLAMGVYIPANIWRARRERERLRDEFDGLERAKDRLITERDNEARRAFALEQERDAARAELVLFARQWDEVRAERDGIYWLRWWMRNAIEAPHVDPARSFYLRWAIAAHYVRDFDTLHRDLLAIANDANRAESERIHARAMASELESTQHVPWEAWAATGKPAHNPVAVQAAYLAAMHSWGTLLVGVDVDGGAPQVG